MSGGNLREKIDELRKQISDKQKFCNVCDKEAMDEINAYESMFEGLRVESECVHYPTPEDLMSVCNKCQDTGKTSRLLTMEEKSMVVDEITRYFCSDEFDGFRLSTGVEVVIK